MDSSIKMVLMNKKILYIVNFVSSGLGQSIMVLLPFIALDLGMNYGQSGFIKSIFNIIAAMFAVVVIKVADRFSNRKILFLSILLAPVTFALLGLSYSFYVLIIYRVIWALAITFQGVITKAEMMKIANNSDRKGATVSDVATSGEIGKLVVSTAIGYVIIWIGWRYASGLVGLLMLILVLGMIVYALRLPYKDVQVARKNIDIKAILKNRKLVVAFSCIIFDGLASTSIPLFIPFLIVFYKYPAEALPNITFFMLIGAILGRFLLGRVADKTLTGRTFAAAETVMGLMALLMVLSDNIIVFTIAAFMIGIFIKGTSPVYSLMLMESADDPNNMKNEFAFETILLNVGGFVSAIAFGFVGDYFGIKAIFVGFLIVSMIAAGLGLLYDRVKK